LAGGLGPRVVALGPRHLLEQCRRHAERVPERARDVQAFAPERLRLIEAQDDVPADLPGMIHPAAR
jgi:hypothetical protein